VYASIKIWDAACARFNIPESKLRLYFSNLKKHSSKYFLMNIPKGGACPMLGYSNGMDTPGLGLESTLIKLNENAKYFGEVYVFNEGDIIAFYRSFDEFINSLGIDPNPPKRKAVDQ